MECTTYMKAFFERYSYESMRMLLDQVAIALFGLALGMTAVKAESDTLKMVTSVGAIIFYLLLLYGVAWRAGSQDRTGIQHGTRVYRPYMGLLISLLANSLNLLLAILVTVGSLGGMEQLKALGRFIALLLQGMYLGVLETVTLNGASLNEYWWMYFVIVAPSLLVSLVGYMAGAKDFHITGMGVPDLPASDRPTKKELRERRQEEKHNRK